MSSIGFVSDNQDLILLILAVGVAFLAVWNAYQHLEISRLKKSSKALFSGRNASSLEEIIMGQISKIKDLNQSVIALKDMDQRIINALSHAVQKVGVVRFNPFSEVGGNQSFAIALLDNYDSGVIILSLYSRDGVRIYAKPVQQGKSQYQMSKEEEEALRIAMRR